MKRWLRVLWEGFVEARRETAKARVGNYRT